MKINYKVRKEFDFGLFDDKLADGHITVKKNKWLEYVDLRSNFEKAHGELLHKINVFKRNKLLSEEEFEFNDPNFGKLGHTKLKLIYWVMVKEEIRIWIEDDKSVVGEGDIDQIKRIVFRHFENIREELGLLAVFGLRYKQHIEPKLKQEKKGT